MGMWIPSLSCDVGASHQLFGSNALRVNVPDATHDGHDPVLPSGCIEMIEPSGIQL